MNTRLALEPQAMHAEVPAEQEKSSATVIEVAAP